MKKSRRLNDDKSDILESFSRLMELIKLMDEILESPHQGTHCVGDEIMMKWKNNVDRFAKQLVDLNKDIEEKY